MFERIFLNGAAGRNRIPFGGFGDHLFTLNTATKWWTISESNRSPPACKAGALPDELIALKWEVRQNRTDRGE